MEQPFEEAYDRWWSAVVRSAWTITRDLTVAEELAQEAFVKAYKRWGRLQRSGHARAWVHRTVMNLALSWVRRARRGRQLENYAAAYAAGPQAGAVGPVGLDGELVELLGQLPRRQREAVFLRVVADLSEADVAAAMGCSAGSVKVHKKRGLDALRGLVDETRSMSHARN